MNSNRKDIDNRELSDAQLTAYALGQLDAEEQAVVEAELARSDEARQRVQQTAALAAQVKQAYEQSPTPAPSESLRAAVEERLDAENAAVPIIKQAGWLRSHWATFAAGALCATLLIAVLLPALQPARQTARRQAQVFTSEGQPLARSHMDSSSRREAVAAASPTLTKSEPYAVSGPAPSRSGTTTTTSDTSRTGLLKETPPASPPTMFGGRGIPAYARKAPEVPPKHDQDLLSTKSKMTLEELAREAAALFQKDRDIAGAPSPPAKKASKTGLDSRYSASMSDNVGFGGAGRFYCPTQRDTEQYGPITDNEFRSVQEQPLSTFAIDVDTASYANVRRFLSEGRLPPPAAVRIEELVNYFTYDYSPPSDGVLVAAHLETSECPWQPEHRLVRIGLKARDVDQKHRGPSNIVFLLDVSGSMGEPDKLPLVKQAMRMLVEQFTEDDRVAIVTYASGTDVRLPSARGNERKRILEVIDSLEAGGCTYGSAGIELAYQQAAAHFVPKGVNRVILCTDGDLNVGITNDDDLVRLIEGKAKSGVFLTVLGFGTGNLKDSKMEKLADKGNGVYDYIDSLREAHRVLVEQIGASLVTVAKDVKIQVEFNPAEVAAYRLIGYENRVMANRDFDNDRKDAGDMSAGHAVTAIYELTPASGADASPDRPLKYQRVPDRNLTKQAHSGELLTLRIRYKEPDGSKSRLLEFTAKDSKNRFDQASTDFRFASAVAAFGMVLRNSPHRGHATLTAVEQYAAGSLGRDPNGYRAEFLDLLRKARTLAPGR